MRQHHFLYRDVLGLQTVVGTRGLRGHRLLHNSISDFCAMPSVLIPTNDDDLGLVEGYRSLGWDVAVGAANFKIRASHYDVIHYQWPEEYSGWQVPTEQQIAEIEEHLRWWSSRATNVFTVHNLYPHSGGRDPASHELYSCFYRHCHLISHFSHTSHRLVLRRVPRRAR